MNNQVRFMLEKFIIIIIIIKHILSVSVDRKYQNKKTKKKKLTYDFY